MTCLSAYHKSDSTRADTGMLKAGWNCIAFTEQECGFLYVVLLNLGSKLCTYHVLSLTTFMTWYRITVYSVWRSGGREQCQPRRRDKAWGAAAEWGAWGFWSTYQDSLSELLFGKRDLSENTWCFSKFRLTVIVWGDYFKLWCTKCCLY